MKIRKHGIKRVVTRKRSLAAVLAEIREPKLSKKEKAEIEEAWRIEIRRRMADFRAGKTKCIPAEQVMRNAYRVLEKMDRQRKLRAGTVQK